MSPATPNPHEKLRQLDDLGAQIYICGPSMEYFRVATEDLFLAKIRVPPTRPLSRR